MSDDQTAQSETISELFARDPFDYTEQSLDRVIEHFRAARKNFTLTGKGQPAMKPPVDLVELGILSR